jgi:hypothetical protein
VIYLLAKALLNDEAFFKSFWVAFGEALNKNINMNTIPERLLRYLNSLTAQKIILMNPEDTIRVCKTPKLLRMVLLPTDLLFNEFKLKPIRPIKIVGTEDGEVELFKLFKWEGWK